LSVGISVVVGLLSFVGACVLVFLLRWCIVRHKLKSVPPPSTSGQTDAASDIGKVARSGNSSSSDMVDKPATLIIETPKKMKSRWARSQPSEDVDEETLRSMRWTEWRQSTYYSRTSMMTSSTNVGEWIDPDELGELVHPQDGGEGAGGSVDLPESRSRSRGRRGVVYPPTAYVHMPLTVHSDGLANIPTLEEITPESLLSHFPPVSRHNPEPTNGPHSGSLSGSGSFSADERGRHTRGRSPLRSTTVSIRGEPALDPQTPRSLHSTFRDPLLDPQTSESGNEDTKATDLNPRSPGD